MSNGENKLADWLPKAILIALAVGVVLYVASVTLAVFSGTPVLQPYEAGKFIVDDRGDVYELTRDGLCIGMDDENGGSIQTCKLDEPDTLTLGPVQFDLFVSTEQAVVYDEERCERQIMLNLDDGAAAASWCLLASSGN